MSETIRLNNQNLIYEQNYTQMPNVIFDYWMEVLTPAEFKVLCCIARKIFGWHKSQDKISLKQIQKMTCLSRQGVIKAISKLIEYQLVIKISSFTEDGDQAANLYTIHVHCIGGGSQLSLLGVVNSVDQGVVNSVDPQKKDIYKRKAAKAAINTCEEESFSAGLAASSEKTVNACDNLEPAAEALAVAPKQSVSDESKADPRVNTLSQKVDKKFGTHMQSEAKKAIQLALEEYPEEVIAASIEQLNEKDPTTIKSIKGLFAHICSDVKRKGPKMLCDKSLIEKRMQIAKCLAKMSSNSGGFSYDDKKLYVYSGATTKEYLYTSNDSFWEEKEKIIRQHIKTSR